MKPKLIEMDEYQLVGFGEICRKKGAEVPQILWTEIE